MSPLGLDLPEAARVDIRARLAGAPLAFGTDASELADLVFHAISEAMAAIDRTAATARTPEAQLLVLSVGISLAGDVLKETNKAMIGTMIEHLVKRRAAGAAT